MTREENVKPNDLGKYFKGIDLKGRLSIIESAKTLLEVQLGDDVLLADTLPAITLADAPIHQKEQKEGLA